jgi:hypothetical protein
MKDVPPSSVSDYNVEWNVTGATEYAACPRWLPSIATDPRRRPLCSFFRCYKRCYAWTLAHMYLTSRTGKKGVSRLKL